MTTNNKKHIIINEIVSMKQLLFVSTTFLSSNEVSVAFNISSSGINTKLPITSFDICKV